MKGARRRTSNDSDVSGVLLSSDKHDKLLPGPKNRCDSTCVFLVFAFLGCFFFIIVGVFPGLATPFAFSFSRRSSLGGRRASHYDSPIEPRIVPWDRWESMNFDFNHSTAFSRSMLNRHLFGAESEAVKYVSDNTARIMIFKLPRSGSTWFTELLNKLPTVFISKEIIQAEFDATFDGPSRLKHLKRSLIWPTGKLSTGPWGGRFATDYWKTTKWNAKLDVIGFTVNPVKVLADYTSLVRQRPSAVVVAFIRSNVVKSVVSSIRGQMTYDLCGADNLRASEATKCAISKTLRIDVDDFRSMLYQRTLLERRFVDMVYSLGRPVYEVTYEDLQLDPESTLAGVLSYCGEPGLAALASAPIISERAGRAPSSGDGWVKRTNDDLREHIVNYAELRKALVGSACLIAQLEVTKAGVSFPPCQIPRALQLNFSAPRYTGR